MEDSPTLRYIDLFCGLGAFHQAFKQWNVKHSNTTPPYECVYACDIDPGVRQLYEANHGLCPDGDIYDLHLETLPAFDLLCAGFPCQPFSIAGNRKGFADDTRGGLFFRILDILDHHTPRQCILENVRNLASIEKGAVLERIISELEGRGYNVSYQVLDSKWHGSPQSRQRVYVIADLEKTYTFPTTRRELRAVSEILDPSETTFLDYRERYTLESTNAKPRSQACHQVARLIHKKTGKGGRQGERIYSIDTCGPTICASSGGPGAKTGLYQIGDQIRRLNASEGLRMFGFPSEYIWTPYVTPEHMLGYLGNSIVVPLLLDLIAHL